MVTFTEQQAQALITDPGTLKRGRELTRPASWTHLGRTDTAAWGECAGSGKNPYQVAIDLADVAFKCSCPSRVFPCKHGAGLLLLLAQHPALLAPAAPPAWLEEWLGKRRTRPEKQAEKEAESLPATELSPEAQARAAAARDRREAQRLTRMQRGAAELETWLADLVRAGLAAAPTQPAAFWEQQAARLVDDQLPGLAGRVRLLAGLPHTGADWPNRLLAELGELMVLTKAFLALGQQPAAAQAEISQQVGWVLKKEEVMAAGKAVADTWQVLISYLAEVPDNPRLQQRFTWLLGHESGRLALLLDFALVGQPFPVQYPWQVAHTGTLHFYPGLLPLRAVPGPAGLTPAEAEAGLPRMPARLTVRQLLDAYAGALAANPWLRELPACLADVLPVPDAEAWWLHHTADGLRLPMEVSGNPQGAWDLLARGGRRLDVFGTWDGRRFQVLTASTPPAPDAWAEPRARVGEEAPLPETPQPEAAGASLPDWPALVRASLLGMRQESMLPELGSSLPLNSATTPEQQLLLAAGALSLIRRAGYLPPPALATPEPPAEADDLPVAGPPVVACLRHMLVEGAHQELLPGYLDQLERLGVRVPHHLLVPLAGWASQHLSSPAAIAAQLGARGRWLVSLHPVWREKFAVSAPTEQSSVWDVGPVRKRRAYLEERLRTDPREARELLADALRTESARVQADLLTALADHLLPEDEALLEPLLKSRSRDVRQAAARLLVLLPDPALVRRLWQRARPLLQLKQKPPGKPRLEVTLPADWSREWLADGIEEKSDEFSYLPGHSKALGNRAAQLGSLLALLPPARWSEYLALPPPALLDLALATEWAVPLLPAWASAAILHHDVAWAAALLHLRVGQLARLRKARCFASLPWSRLAAVLPDAEIAVVLTQPLIRMVQQHDPEWPDAVRLLQRPWPTGLTRAVIAQLRKMILQSTGHTSWHLHGLFQELGAFLVADADALWSAEALAEASSADVQLESAVRKLVAILRFRHEMARSLTDTPVLHSH